ncbi:hypothetical protein AAUPMC_13606 [Pasteurella multocida subsp. multocida str. Anand1_cattle]|nr:hypothetical protein AAUPMC_13606 [Pasteurella multocida subsp. multocida str. Anand1_cattle]
MVLDRTAGHHQAEFDFDETTVINWCEYLHGIASTFTGLILTERIIRFNAWYV